MKRVTKKKTRCVSIALLLSIVIRVLKSFWVCLPHGLRGGVSIFPLLYFCFSLKIARIMSLRKEKVEGYRKQLFARRESIAADLRAVTAQLINDESVYTDAVDQAAADTDKNFTLQMKSRDRNLLWQIDEAIKRLDGGTFGECERCNESIAEGRIDAFPFTTLCIDCKAELESEEHRFPGRS